MKAMVLAAGLGTRLRPWTLEHPKALVPVKGRPMLGRVLASLRKQGFADIVVNIHHFGEQIRDYLKENESDRTIEISDETDCLLDTGGGILKASELLFSQDRDPFLVHNVDIMSNADLRKLMEVHLAEDNDVTMLTSDRDSSRKLIFGEDGSLKGWHNLSTGELRPAGMRRKEGDREHAFSGIYVIGENAIEKIKDYSVEIGEKVFPVMDFFLKTCGGLKIGEYFDPSLRLIDIGKPATLERANLEEL